MLVEEEGVVEDPVKEEAGAEEGLVKVPQGTTQTAQETRRRPRSEETRLAWTVVFSSVTEKLKIQSSSQ